MQIQHLKAADYRVMTWKNGGGSTAEIAVSPADAPLEAFDWRLSMATVASNGAFSCFDGIDRTLTVLDGDGIDLTIAGEKHRLTAASPPFSFSGDADTHGALIDGPITDLNVMTRRGHFNHKVEKVELANASFTGDAASTIAIIACADACRINIAGTTFTLQQRDCLLMNPSAEGDRTFIANGCFLMVSLTKTSKN